MALLRQVGLGRPMTRAEFDENMNEFPNKFASIAALKAATWLQIGQVVTVEEYHAGVGGGMLFGRIVAGGTGTDDGGSYIDLPTSGLQFEQNFPSVVSVKMFGARGDGVTDDTSAIQSAESYSSTSVLLNSGTYLIANDITGDFYSYGDVVIKGSSVYGITNLKTKNKYSYSQPPLFSCTPRYIGLKNAWYTTVDSELYTYKAFPFFFVGSDSLHAIGWSSGEGHGNSDEILYAKIDPETHEMQKGVFYDLNTLTSYLDFLEPYLAEGEFVNFRSVFTVIRESGVLNLYVNSTVEVSGDTYALWGTPFEYNGDWYTGGYRTVGGYQRTALFKSVDKMKTWSFVGLVASNSARQYTEAAFVNTSGSNIVSVIREDLTGTRDLVKVASSDGGLSWTPAAGTLLTPIGGDVKGTQPCILKLSNDSIMLIAGKRTGSSGVSAGGSLTDDEDITGLMYWTSSDGGETWSEGVQIAPSWSTDCGNPSAKQLRNGNIAVCFYTALGATSGNVGVEPTIIYLEFDPVNTKSQ